MRGYAEQKEPNDGIHSDQPPLTRCRYRGARPIATLLHRTGRRSCGNGIKTCRQLGGLCPTRLTAASGKIVVKRGEPTNGTVHFV